MGPGGPSDLPRQTEVARPADVDLRWKHEGVDAWTGKFIGEAVPEWTGLGAQARQWERFPGRDVGHWGPWCAYSFALGPWGKWPVELKGLDFNRERVQQQLPPPPPAIQLILGFDTNQKKSERSGPTFDYEAQLRTTSFKSATLVFHELDGADEVYSCGGGGSGSDPYSSSPFVGPFIEAQPLDTNWRMTAQGPLSASPVDLNEAGSYPVIARRVWLNGHQPDSPSPQREEFLHWKGEVVLTHTPSGG